MIRLNKDGVRWELQPAFAPLLEQLLDTGREVVKESPTKLVTRHALNGRTYYVKRYRHHAVPFRPLKFFFKVSQGREEWALAQRLEALDVPIVHHLAYGERWTLGGLQESILITEGFDGVPLDQANGLDWKLVPELLHRLHERGVLQRDLNPGNILARTHPPELRLVDLHGIVVKPALSDAERIENLATIAMTLPIPVSPEVALKSAELRRWYAARHARRCLRHNREFAPMCINGVNWQVRVPFLTDALRRILEQPDEFLRTRPKLLKAGRTSTVGAGDGLVMKRFNLRKVRNLFIELVRPSRARRAFLKAYHLELAGIPTPRPLAAGDRRIFRFLRQSYVVMEEIPGATDLSQWQPERGRVAGAVARVIARLHDEGFRHRDLKETNILLDARGQPFLIDLEGLRYAGLISPAEARADLARLTRGVLRLPQFTRADREAFLRAYCKERRIKPRDLLKM